MWGHMSLKKKLFLTLLLVPTLSLLSFLYFLAEAVYKDKSVFIFELQRETLKRMVRELDAALMDQSRQKLVLLSDGQEWKEPGKDGFATKDLSDMANQVCHPARQILWKSRDKDWVYWRCAIRDGHKEIWEFGPEIFTEILSGQPVFNVFVLHRDGLILSDDGLTKVGTSFSQSFSGSLLGQRKTGQLDLTDKQGAGYLASFEASQKYPIFMVAMVSREAPWRAVLPFMVRGIIVLLCFLIFLSIAGFFISRNLTRRIDALARAMLRFAKGEETVKLEESGRDEVATLAKSFNRMSEEIHQLIKVKEEKTKVEHEMSLAAELQGQFFPPQQSRLANLEVLGKISPAVECGGDWWFVFEAKDAVVVGCGDVTGHGLNSALITGAARAALVQVEDNYISPSNLATVLNKALFDTAKGNLQMTLLVLEIGKEGSLRYCNASHEAPYVFYGSKGLEPLVDTHGARLGEARDTFYEESTFELPADWRIWMFSDGIYEIQGENGKKLSERQTIKWIRETFHEMPAAHFESFQNKFEACRNGKPLVDDVTTILVSPF